MSELVLEYGQLNWVRQWMALSMLRAYFFSRLMASFMVLKTIQQHSLPPLSRSLTVLFQLIAAYFPNAEITGTDLSPVQPSNVPDNVHFYIDDAMETDWLWPENHFDYIHASMLSGSFRSFDDLLRTAYRYLKPGGWIECHDVDIAIRCDDGSVPLDALDSWGPYPFQNWITLLTKATSTMNPPRPIRSAHYISKWMREVGFKNIQESVRKIPITPWHKDPYLREIGEWNQMNWLEGLAAFSWVPFGERGLGWTQEQIEVFLVDVRKSLLNLDYHAYNNLHVVIARKPFC